MSRRQLEFYKKAIGCGVLYLWAVWCAPECESFQHPGHSIMQGSTLVAGPETALANLCSESSTHYSLDSEQRMSWASIVPVASSPIPTKARSYGASWHLSYFDLSVNHASSFPRLAMGGVAFSMEWLVVISLQQPSALNLHPSWSSNTLRNSFLFNDRSVFIVQSV